MLRIFAQSSAAAARNRFATLHRLSVRTAWNSQIFVMNPGLVESRDGLLTAHWEHAPERGRSPAAARRQLGGLRKIRKPWSWRERCARGPGALRVQQFTENSSRPRPNAFPAPPAG